MEKNKNKLLKYYFKNYLEGKELYERNKEESFQILTKNLEILEKIKSEKLNDKYKELIIETEIETYKIITETIEYNIETENIIEVKDNNSKLYDLIEKGDTSEIKNIKYGQIDFSKKHKDKGTLLHYAIKYSDCGFLINALKKGARIDTVDNDGHTLLEYACLELDPNMINFLIKYGADMKKHLYFRDNSAKLTLKYNSIDIAIIYKLLLYKYIEVGKITNNYTDKLKKYFNKESIGLNNYSTLDLLMWLNSYLNTLPKESIITYINIVEEELNYSIKNKLGCPPNKIEILLTTLIPFINYEFNISIDWVILLELKYLLLKILKNKKELNKQDIQNEIFEKVYNIYINKNLLSEDYIGILLSQLVTKIKV